MKQILLRLPMALAQVKAGLTSQKLRIYSLHLFKRITKKGIKIFKMDSIFVNSENSRISDWPILVLSLTDKIDLKKKV